MIKELMNLNDNHFASPSLATFPANASVFQAGKTLKGR
jgi:hypothetical protein